MKHPLPNLESLKAFEAAARHLSFTLAADELCITKGAISYQIKRLEAEVNQSLFKRNVRQVLLTDAGQQLYQSTQSIFTDLSNCLDKLKPGINNNITIGVTTYVAARWLSPMVTEFCLKHPEVSLQFVHTVNSSTFNINDVDVAIRWDRCGNILKGIRLMETPMPLFPVCSTQLLQWIHEGGTADDFNGATLLCEDREQDLWTEWAGDKFDISDNPRRVIADANVRVQAAIDGQGMILADSMMQSEINSGALVTPCENELLGYGYTIMAAKQAQQKPMVKLLIDWLLN